MPDLQNIKRNTNDFSFTETVASLANNREYKSGYIDLINGKTNDKTYFWTALSAVGEEVGSVIYENVLNYIDNVANINTCKLRALTSIAKVLGVTEFAVLKNLKTVPEDVLKMMDIFSINRAYLLNIGLFNTDFVQDLLSSTLDEEALLSAEETLSSIALSGSTEDPSNLSTVFSVFAGISNEKYERYIEEVFFRILSSKLFQTYGNVLTDFVYVNLSSQGTLSSTGDLEYTRSTELGDKLYNRYWTNNPNENSYRSDYPRVLYRYKKALNVPPGFNQSKIVDDIENGLDFLDNYQGGELSVLQLEIDERAKAKFSTERGYESNRLDTRYSYYNEQEVRQYIKFVDDMYVLRQTEAAEAKSIEDISSSFLNWSPYLLKNGVSPYDIDPNYSNVSLSSNASLLENVNNQFYLYKDVTSSDASFAEFIYRYYADVFSEDVQSNDLLSVLSEGNLVRIVARILKDVCLAIVDIREKLKSQSQRNYMTGTKLLIEYILNEYLINTLINTYGTDPEKTKEQESDSRYKTKHQSVGAQIVEFVDTTEYFNIDLSGGAYSHSGVNPPYFSDLSNGGYSGAITGRGLYPIDIRNFYLSSLGISSNYISDDNSYYDFMSAVYEVGTTKTFVGQDGAIVLDKEFLDADLSISLDIQKLSVEKNFTDEDYEFFLKNWCLETPEGFKSVNYELLSDYNDVLSDDISVVSSELEKYNQALSIRLDQQTELILKYHGTDVAYYPWYNYKNQDYPTFQAHPYLYNFTEHQNDELPVENAFYGNANEDLLNELRTENISVYLGELGNLLRYWRNSPYDYSGYKSRYENSLHVYGSSNSNGLYSVTHYDGIFYPPAIDLYKRYVDKDHPLSDVVKYADGHEVVLSGLDLLSAHMTKFVDDRLYEDADHLTISEVSSMWHYYSHLNLSRAERERIAEQLVRLSADIMEVGDAKYRISVNSSAEPYDVYRYALDYNNNSLILLKRYSDGNRIIPNKDATQTQKRNTPGQLWIKYNSHPIAFPAFLQGELSNCSNVLLDDLKETVDWNRMVIQNARIGKTSKYGTGASINDIYDFDVAGNGQYLVFAIENQAPSSEIPVKNYKNSVTIASRILQRKRSNYIYPDEEIRQYMLTKSGPTFLYPNNQGRNAFNSFYLSNLVSTDYEFDGYFQNGSILYAGYFKRETENNDLTSIGLNAIAYPAEEEQSFNPESRSFCFKKTFVIPQISTDFARTDANAKVKLGYFSKDNEFAVVVANEILSSKPLYIQDFVGFNNKRLSSELEELSAGYGFTEYNAATSGEWETSSDSKNIDSFDRFDHLVSIYSITESASKDASIQPPAIYALNSDASYIPLYYGLDGQNLHYKLKDQLSDDPISYNKWWHSVDDNISSEYVPRNSMELLGYSCQDFGKLVEDKENTIYLDNDTGKYTSIDTNNLLKNALRVYEDFLSGEYAYQVYNKGFLWETVSSDIVDIDFKIDLSSITSETSSMYNILLLNCKNGQDRNPILAGPLSKETISSSYYDFETTAEEEYMLSWGFGPENLVHVVGTPNPFNVKDTTFGLDYTNHIFNVDGLSAKLEWNNEEERFHIKVSLKRNDNTKTFAIQSEQLALFVYKPALDQFNKFHYMEPSGKYPHNAAVSSWNLPWKDKSHAWLYVNEFNEFSAMWGKRYGKYEDYLDKRIVSPNKNSGADSYKRGMKLSGVFIESVVGHLPISAYDSSTGELSISEDDPRLQTLSLMENIELSSLTSFNDSYYLSTGQITWKISEEDEFDYLKLMYPPTLIDSLLYDKFLGCNKEHVSYNVFELSNTYIFQLEDPISVANKIGTIAVPIGTAATEFSLAYEDYLIDQISVDVGGTNFMSYEEMMYLPSSDTVLLNPSIDIDVSAETSAVNAALSSEDVETMNDALSVAKTYEYYPEESEKNSKTGTIDYFLLSATPEEISDYLKVYVNWRRYPVEGSDDEIEMFFNFPNLFLSPYSYKTKNGEFRVEYKPNTYLRLKSGQDGYLYIVFQFKYYDSTGTLCGIRDLPILTYHVYNVSDDKPKFVITKTYEIDNRDGRYTYPGDDDENVVYVVVDSKTYGHDTKIMAGTPDGSIKEKTIDECISYNYCTNADLYLDTTLEVLTPVPMEYLDIEMAYERGRMPEALTEDDPEFVFEPTISKPGVYTEYKGNISAHIDNGALASNLQFTLLMGSKIDEETLQRTFPIEILNMDGRDINGNKPKFVFVNGMITIDDNTAGIKTGAYLARELNLSALSSDQDREDILNPDLSSEVWDRYSLSAASQNRKANAGWILEESRRALIRMYSTGTATNRRILAELSGEQAIPLKTTGTRESRFDKFQDMCLLEDTDKIDDED